MNLHVGVDEADNRRRRHRRAAVAGRARSSAWPPAPRGPAPARDRGRIVGRSVVGDDDFDLHRRRPANRSRAASIDVEEAGQEPRLVVRGNDERDVGISTALRHARCTPRTAPAIIRFSAAIDRPPSSVGGIVAKPIADAFG